MAYAMIHQYGMDPVIGPLSFPAEDEGQTVVGKKPYSRRLANTIDELGRELLKREVLNYADIEALIGPPPFGKKHLIEVLDLGPDSSDKKSKSSPEREGSPGKPQQNLSGATATTA
ncbi:hypothetical protein HPB49_004930 [Dermacentor silvarum]|uniref:Uncharacterized protein n=1 Tax=Dermacentor silvarum TaxID=543639 RepID=A0ACB8DUU4_DERSI|nr:hypothetical protein HPB49_004930 [Dermacentor silvarum]